MIPTTRSPFFYTRKRISFASPAGKTTHEWDAGFPDETFAESGKRDQPFGEENDEMPLCQRDRQWCRLSIGRDIQ